MKAFLGAVLLCAGTIAAGPGLAQQALTTTDTAASVQALVGQAKAKGAARVIVQLREGRALATDGSPAADASYNASLQAASAAVVSDVFGAAGVSKAKFIDFVPMFAITASADEINALAADSRVERVYPDDINEPTLIQSLPIIKMTQAGTGAYAHGATGTGRAVAILDTGVDKNHEFLKSGKVISEACYSTTDAANKSTSLCPGGAGSSTASGAGLDCSTTISGCGHGTHVAGIAAGLNKSISRGEPVNGVAKNAGVVAIKVFSKFDKTVCGTGATQPCARAYTSDIIAGLTRVYALRTGVATRKIDAANMSLGGAAFTTGFCDSDPRKPIIDKLRTAGIATTISAGNEGYVNADSPPGCISTAISVSASTKTIAGKPERVASYSNIGIPTDLLAPGGDFNYPKNDGTDPILSSTGGTYKYFSGTSMAAPHVAGAIAAIRSKAACKTKTVSQIEAAFKATGPIIKDHRLVSGVTPFSRHRLDVVAALKKLGCY